MISKGCLYGSLSILVLAAIGGPVLAIYTGSAEQCVAASEMPVGGDTAGPLPIRKYK